MPTNVEISDHLIDCARLYALSNQTARAHAFAKAALSVQAEVLAIAGRERSLGPGQIRFIGQTILDVISEFVKTGTTERWQTLYAGAGTEADVLTELARLPCLGPVDAVTFWRMYGCSTVSEFEVLVQKGVIAKDPRDARIYVGMKMPDKVTPPSFLEHPTDRLYAGPLARGRCGDLHCHANFSDGKSSILDMATEAQLLGYKWLGICEHASGGARVEAVGLEMLDLYFEVFDSVQDAVPEVRLYRGLEVDVSPTGALLASPDLLAAVDYVVLGVHIPGPMPWVERLKTAFAHPKVKLWAHPAASLALGPPVDAATWRVLAGMAGDAGVALELTAQPGYAALSSEQVLVARVAGVRWAVGSDAHRVWDMRQLVAGYQAMREFSVISLIDHQDVPW